MPRFVAFRHLILCLLFVLFTGPPAEARAREQLAKDPWVEVRSQNFTLYSQTNARKTRRIALRLEGLRSALGKLSGLALNAPVPTRIYVFASDRDFDPYKYLYQGRPAEIAGYFAGREDGNFIAINAENIDDATAIVFHEYVHHVLANNFRNLPVWFNEGLAEYYSTFEIEGTTAAVGKPASEHWLWLRDHDLLPLAELFAVDHESPTYNEGDRRGSFYAQSWALVHYLLLDPIRQKQVIGFLQALVEGRDPVMAFGAAFGTDYPSLLAELSHYLRRLDFPYLRYTIDTAVVDETRERPLSRVEALVLLGDLLVHQSEPRAEAEEHYRAALALEADHPGALMGLALLAERRLDPERARSFLERALGRNDRDPMVLYHLGRLLLTEGGTEADRARQLLRRAVVLRPDFGPAWAHLSYAITFLDPLPKDALGIGQTAFRLLPSRWDVALNLLNHYTRLGHREIAESMVAGYFTRLDQGAHLPKARELLIQMELRQAYDAINGGRPDEAAKRVDVLEKRWAASLDPLTRRQIFELRRSLAEHRAIARYNEAVSKINAGYLSEGRRLLEALVLDDPEGPVAEGARQLLVRMARKTDGGG